MITFVNTHGAMATEKYLKQQFKIVILPTPREISRGCGIAIRFQPEDRDGVLAAMEEFTLEKDMYGIYHFTNGQYFVL